MFEIIAGHGDTITLRQLSDQRFEFLVALQMLKDGLRALILTIGDFEERAVIGEMKWDEVQMGAASVMGVDVQGHPVEPGLQLERLDALRRIVFQRDVCADKCLLY